MIFSWLERFALYLYLHLGDRRKKSVDQRAMLEEVLAEFNKARRGGSNRELYLVRLSGEAMEHIEALFKRELGEIKYKKFIKSIPAVPYQPS